jgi:hypothetical protein
VISPMTEAGRAGRVAPRDGAAQNLDKQNHVRSLLEVTPARERGPPVHLTRQAEGLHRLMPPSVLEFMK